MNGLIESYRSMARISTAMVEAARANDWDRLASLELDRARLCSEIRDRQAGLPGVEAEQREMASLIEQMLADDREVLTHARPWLESTRRFLSGAVRTRNVRATYGTHGP